jgi:hypothetical protein
MSASQIADWIEPEVKKWLGGKTDVEIYQAIYLQGQYEENICRDCEIITQIEKSDASNTEAMNVLHECIDIMRKKSHDYQNPNSRVRQADHYRRGIDTIHDIMMGKMFRAQSLIESGNTPNNESLEDTYKDLINYASFAVSWLRGKMDGQDESRDIFNDLLTKPHTSTTTSTLKPAHPAPESIDLSVESEFLDDLNLEWH